MTGRVADEFSEMPEDERGIYSIGTIARMYDIHQQSLRQYERLGLLVPNRTSGNTRMYSKRDIERLEIILNLTQDMGVNLAGVEIVIKLKGQIAELQMQMHELLNRVREHIEIDYENRMRGMIEETAIVPMSKARGIKRIERS